MPVKIAIGLGNTGSEYDGTRHNAGRVALMNLVDTISKKSGAKVNFVHNKYCAATLAKVEIAGNPLVIAFADGYMNNSGVNLNNILRFLKFNISETVVLCDDINMDVGRVKLSRGGSAGGHNGIADIMNRCGNDFIRIRLGVGGKIDKRMNLADHVLGRFYAEDLEAIEKIKIYDCFQLLMTKGFEAAQNVMNRTDTAPKKPKIPIETPAQNTPSAEIAREGKSSDTKNSDSLDRLAKKLDSQSDK